MHIQRLYASEVQQFAPALAQLLQDAVAYGASVGFLHPISYDVALEYWQEVAQAVQGPERILLAAFEGEELAGTVQLNLVSKPNGSHRAEVAKLMVHTRFRRRGIGKALMESIESEARRAGRSTLVLDTRSGDPSEQLYRSIGYTCAGIIPEYARSSNGALHSTVFMYKLLK